MNALNPGQNTHLQRKRVGVFIFQSLSDAPGQVAPGHQCEPSLLVVLVDLCMERRPL